MKYSKPKAKSDIFVNQKELMRRKAPYPIYDLSNPHFQNIKLVNQENETLNGQFVQFKVVEDDIEYIYPSDKFCFLLKENKIEFWNAFRQNNGEFKEMPEYLLHFGLNQITKIIIEPVLVLK